jgi:hypothetical protein
VHESPERVVGYTGEILGRHLLADESEFSWEIPVSCSKCRIAVQPHPYEVLGRWLLTVFRNPLRTGARKPLNLYGGKWAVHAFRKHLFYEQAWLAAARFSDRTVYADDPRKVPWQGSELSYSSYA